MKIKLTKDLMYVPRPVLDKACATASAKYGKSLGYIGTDKKGVHHFQSRGDNTEYTLTTEEIQ